MIEYRNKQKRKPTNNHVLQKWISLVWISFKATKDNLHTRKNDAKVTRHKIQSALRFKHKPSKEKNRKGSLMCLSSPEYMLTSWNLQCVKKLSTMSSYNQWSQCPFTTFRSSVYVSPSLKTSNLKWVDHCCCCISLLSNVDWETGHISNIIQ